MEDWRKSAKGQARIKRARQFLLECTEDGDGFSVSYITLKHHYYSWCQSIGLPREECGFGEINHALNERALVEKQRLLAWEWNTPSDFLATTIKVIVKVLRTRSRKPFMPNCVGNGNTCALCGRPILTADKVHIDHIIPVRQGGMDDPSNLQVVHDICNLTKG